MVEWRIGAVYTQFQESCKSERLVLWGFFSLAVNLTLVSLTLFSALETVVYLKPCPIAHLAILVIAWIRLIFFIREGSSLVSGIEKSHYLYRWVTLEWYNIVPSKQRIVKLHRCRQILTLLCHVKIEIVAAIYNEDMPVFDCSRP